MADLVPVHPKVTQQMVDALLAQSHKPQGIPLPRPDPRDWTDRIIAPMMQNQDHLRGLEYPQPGAPIQQQDAGNGIFGVPQQHLQQMAGDVIPFPQEGKSFLDLLGAIKKIKPDDTKSLLNNVLGAPSNVLPFTGKSSSLPQPTQMVMANKPVDQNLPQLPTSGFVPSLSPKYMNDTHPLSRPQAPNLPPVFWQPG